MDERDSERVVVDLELAARIDDRLARVLLHDLSVEGCMIEAKTELLPAIGGALEVSLPFAGWTAGTVAWAQGRWGGVLFVERLHEAVVHHLGFKPALEPAHMLRDQFGRAVLARTKPSRLS